MKGLLALVATLTAASVAHAGNIVLESYTGDRPADAQRLMTPILTELESHGYDAGDKIGRQLDSQSSSAIGNSVPGDFAAQVEKGNVAWVSGQFEDALGILLPLIKKAHDSPTAVVDDESIRQSLQKALIAAALSELRKGDQKGGHEHLLELVHAFPDAVVARGTYGAEAADAFTAVKREVDATGKGTLAIQLSDDSGSVFVDERYIGQTSPSLAPGDYRVFAKVGKQISRVHHVTVRANEKAPLALDVGLDAAIRTTGWTGLDFATQADRDAHEGDYAAKLARSLDAKAVIVIGIDQVRGRPSIVGSLVSLDNGREIRRASVPIDPDPTNDKLRALARYVAGDGPASADIEVLSARAESHDTAAPPPQEPQAEGHRWGGWKYVATTGAVAGLGTGAVLVAINGNCVTPAVMPGHPCPDQRDTLVPGLVTAGVGVGLAVVAVYLFVHKGESATTGTAYVAPTSGGAMFGYTRGF